MILYEITTSDEQPLEFQCHSRLEKAIIKARLRVTEELTTPYSKTEALYILTGETP